MYQDDETGYSWHVCVLFMWQDKLGKSVNMRAMNMLGKAEEKVQEVIACGGCFLC